MAAILKLTILLATSWSASGKKATSPVDRSYATQGLQFYSNGSPAIIYPNIPAIYVPGQVGVLPSGHPGSSGPPSVFVPPVSGGPPQYHPSYPSRPSYAPSYPPQQSSSTYSIEPSIELTDSKPPSSSLGSTYGPPKPLELSFRKPPTHYRVQYKYKSHPTRSRPPSNRPLMYTHMHKGHFHTHYIPPQNFNQKPQKPVYHTPSTPSPIASTEDPQKVYNHHAHPSPAQSPSPSFPSGSGPSSSYGPPGSGPSFGGSSSGSGPPSSFGGPPGSSLSFGGPPGSSSSFGGPPGSSSGFGGPPGGSSGFGGPPGSSSGFGGPPSDFGGPPGSSSSFQSGPSFGSSSGSGPSPTYGAPPGSGSSSSTFHPLPPSSSQIRFPASSSSPGELTQALFGAQGIIKNYDASIPIKIPKPRPNIHEVKDILKNADLHFIDVLENKPTTPSSVPHQSLYTNYQHHEQKPSYQQFQPPEHVYQPGGNEERYPVSQLYQPSQPQLTNFFSQDVKQPGRPYAELYDHRFQIPPSYHSNHLEQDSGSSDTIRIPVAVFKGVVPPNMIHLPVERSDEDTSSSESTPSGFTPSRTTSDWIPMSGTSAQPKPESVRNLNHFGDDFFEELKSKGHQKKSVESHTSTPLTSNGHQNFPVAEKLTSLPPGDIIYGTSGDSDPKTYDTTGNSGSKGYDTTGNSGSKTYGTTGNSGSKTYGTTGNSGSTTYGTAGNSGAKIYGTTGNSETKTFGTTSNSGHKSYGSTGHSGQKTYGTTGSSSQKLGRSEIKRTEKVGDIISGRIPGDHNPFGSIGGERRPSNVVTSSTSNIGDASDLVVSSVIKFSR